MTLLLHLDGNAKQWILCGIGGGADVRDRPGEFSARTGADASVLFAQLHRTVGGVVDLIRSLPHQRLAEKVSIQGYDTTLLSAIFHVVEHFSGHTYQIILLTKRFTGKDLGIAAPRRLRRFTQDKVQPTHSSRRAGDVTFRGAIPSHVEDRRSDMIRLVLRRATNLLAAVVVVGGGLAAPAAAFAWDQAPAVGVSTLTPERMAASAAAGVGLIGAVIGGVALARSAGRTGTGNGRRGAIVALVLGPIGLVIGGLVVAAADGGLGTGNGLGGGIVAMIVGLIGMALGGLALARSRRTA